MDRDQASVLKLLSEVHPFAGLPEPERRALAARLPLRRFGDEETLFREGERAEAAWLVHGGQVRIEVLCSGGRPLQMELLGRGELFGLFCRLGGKRADYPCTAVAKGPAAVLSIPDELFLSLYRRHGSVAREACELCAERLGRIQQLVAFGREPAERRLAEVLLRLRGAGSEVRATRRELALQTGTTIETVFRILAAFRERGWIATGRGSVRVLKSDALVNGRAAY